MNLNLAVHLSFNASKISSRFELTSNLPHLWKKLRETRCNSQKKEGIRQK
jgi:hypothetical protein